MTDNPRTPGDVLCDVLVYAPLGFAFEARRLLPELAQRGRTQVQTARYIGEFVVQKAGAQLGPELEKASHDVGNLVGSVLARIGMAIPPLLPVRDPAAGSAAGSTGDAPAAERTADVDTDVEADAEGADSEAGAAAEPARADSEAATAAEPATVEPEPVTEPEALEAGAVESGPVDAGTERAAPADIVATDGEVASEPEAAEEDAAPDVGDLAIPEYDSLAASQVVPRLSSLDLGELTAVRRYEASNRGRRTILNRADQLLGQRRSSGG